MQQPQKDKETRSSSNKNCVKTVKFNVEAQEVNTM